MYDLTDTVKRIKRNKNDTNKILFSAGDIFVLDDGKYIDSRTRFDVLDECHIVFPVARESPDALWYICPNCSELHLVSLSARNGKKHNSGCAGMVKNSNKRFFISTTGRIVKINTSKIIFAKSDANTLGFNE